jgi:predicted dehydrogenase
MEKRSNLKISLIGYGYWGRNIARTLKELNIKIETIFDLDKNQINEAKKLYNFKKYNSLEDILKISDIVFIATPPSTHYKIAKKALNLNTHIFVEKPFTLSLKEAYELIEIAEKKNLKYMVDHVFIYSEPVKFLKNNLASFGDIFYINSRRINLGLFQYATDVIWDLAVHDLSIIDYLVGLDIKKVNVFKKKYKNFPNEAIANINLELKNDILIGINVSWLSPVKVREMIIGGTKKTALYDDTVEDKIKLFNAGIILETTKNEAMKYLVKYNYGDIEVPNLPNKMSLTNAISHFIYCVKNNKTPITDKKSILPVIEALEIISKV